MPDHPEITLEDALLQDVEYWKAVGCDDAYLAESLARKNDVPFVM